MSGCNKTDWNRQQCRVGLEIKKLTGKQGVIRIALKYGENKTQVIRGLKRISKPGLRIYTSCEDCPKVMKGLGIAVLSTSHGVMTDKSARKAKVGGEVLAYIW